ncbi:hypothetical protein [Cryptosporangium sp. NPDC048952]|uniref:hypothetical protein n=1 Tax=Cryptosporangium sp. NPDC048952 TaxID=3363961 RepID=UPI003719D72C
MRTRTRALAGGMAAAAVLGAGAAVPAAAADVTPGGRVDRTEVTFDRAVVRQLNRLGVRIRAVDAEQRGRGDDVRITFRAERNSRPGQLEHRGGVLFDSPRRPDFQISRPSVDLRRETVSFQIGRDRVTLLSVDTRGRGRDGDRDRPGDQREGQNGQNGREGNRPQNGQQGGAQQGGAQQGGAQQRPAAGGGGAGDDRDEVTLRLTRDGERLLDRALGTDWFWTGQVIGTAEYEDR